MALNATPAVAGHCRRPGLAHDGRGTMDRTDQGLAATPLHPTPYADVNIVLRDFLSGVQAILGSRFRGMYLSGSLALGDFAAHRSDIDFIVVTDGELSDDRFVALQGLHAGFDASGSPWATEVEVAYIPQDALRRYDPARARHPHIERGETLVMDHFHSDWILQRYILREHGVVVAGPDPRTLIDPVDAHDLRRAVAALGTSWLEPARHDPLALRHRGYQAYMVLTLCRMLYTLNFGAVVPKPVAARWAQKALGERWAALIEQALTWRKDRQEAPGGDEVDNALALLEYTLTRCRQLDLLPTAEPGGCVEKTSKWQQMNDPVIAEYRATGGQVTGHFAGRPLLLLTTTGARSGQPRTTPLNYSTDGDRLVVIASKGGSPAHPDWYHNLVAHPEVTVELGAETIRARASTAGEPERTHLFDRQAAQMPFFAEYQRKVARQIPIVVLERLD